MMPSSPTSTITLQLLPLILIGNNNNNHGYPGPERPCEAVIILGNKIGAGLTADLSYSH